MISIRKIKPNDLKEVRHVSLKASSHPNKSGDELIYHYALYTDYYVTYQADTSFVVVDENNQVKGYLLCAENFEEYEKTMLDKIIPTFKNKELKERALFEMNSYRQFKDSYPAHLHIAIDPSHQHGGIGSLMMNELLLDLKKKNINGVMLEVTHTNVKAIHFYKKNGFDVIYENKYGKLMGITI